MKQIKILTSLILVSCFSLSNLAFSQVKKEEIVSAIDQTANCIVNVILDEQGKSRCDYNLTEGKWYPYEVPWQQAKQMDEDALAILQNTPVLVPGEEGLKDIKVVEAVYRSVKENGRVLISG